MARCTVPPAGWYCTREPGHDGPCAAHPVEMTGWASPSLGRAYAEVERLRANLAQHPESGIDEALRRALDAIEAADVELTGMAA
jgi:hypothetical protein